MGGYLGLARGLEFKPGNSLSLIKTHPLEGTKENIFEQMMRFTLSERYVLMKNLINLLTEKAEPFPYTANFE